MVIASSFKAEIKIRIINRCCYAISDWKGIGGRICQAIRQHSKANNIYKKDYNKNKESSYLKYWDVNNLYGWAMFAEASSK